MRTLAKSGLIRPGIELIDWRAPELEHVFRDRSAGEMADMARRLRAEATYAQYTEQAILNAMFGNLGGQVGATIAAATTAVTSITTRGSIGSGNIDNTPATGSMIFTATPGSGTTVNTGTNPHAFLNSGGAPTATTFPIASQSMGLALTIGDSLWLGGGSTNTGPTNGAIPSWQLTDLYIGLSTQAFAGATQANVLSGEPTSTGTYGRIVVLNNRASFPIATAASPSVLTAGGPFSFAQSTAAWSTGATNLQTMFIADSTSLAGGNVLAIGQLTTPQAVNAANITLSFASGQITITLT